ncbi:LURP-one-related/scramblase family protein [Faecalibaculum rodentium]|uniref:LURP-one-related/scramblase family protein n=1 Tax=Faecalibaculum rodentium TaxID=1702221 RepID=UPI0023F34CC5|nr:hypothetical protein [Faecalibaculum rodentium]
MNHSLYISQKFFSLWGKYTVENEAGQTVYTVQGEPSLTRRQKVYDDAGSQVGELHKVLFSWLARFEIDMDGRSVGTIQQKFGFRPKLELDYFGWRVQGDIWGWNYDVCNAQGQVIAQIRKEIWHLTDHYAIHFNDLKDGLPLLLLALAIDCIHDAQAAASSSS